RRLLAQKANRCTLSRPAQQRSHRGRTPTPRIVVCDTTKQPAPRGPHLYPLVSDPSIRVLEQPGVAPGLDNRGNEQRGIHAVADLVSLVSLVRTFLQGYSQYFPLRNDQVGGFR